MHLMETFQEIAFHNFNLINSIYPFPQSETNEKYKCQYILIHKKV